MIKLNTREHACCKYKWISSLFGNNWKIPLTDKKVAMSEGVRKAYQTLTVSLSFWMAYIVSYRESGLDTFLQYILIVVLRCMYKIGHTT